MEQVPLLFVISYVWLKEEGLQRCVPGPHRHPPSTACSKTNHCRLRKSHLVSASSGLHECENSGLCVPLESSSLEEGM